MLILDDLVQLNDVGVVHAFENFDFARDAVDVFLRLYFALFEDFHCDLLASECVVCQADFAESALAQDFAESVVANFLLLLGRCRR